MLLSRPNDIKVYNLSCGKSLPEWISDKKKRKLQQNDANLRRRIELIQDFAMPDVSGCVSTSNDGNYIFATGTYKPRVRCYDVRNLSMKFERCFDAEVIKMLHLSDGYEKLVFLQEERWLEFHVQYGHYFRTRIPKFGRDMAYNTESCDLYIVGSGNEAYRLNLEQGRFLAPFVTDAHSLTACDISPEHFLVMVGTAEGRIEAWDSRAKKRAAISDCALSLSSFTEKSQMSSVSTIKFKDGLHMAVGMSTGQVLMYDIRSDKPLLVKDHQYDLPVKSIAFSSTYDQQFVLSMDSRSLKVWGETSGKTYTTIESDTDLNQLCLVPNSGLLFMAHEAPKILTYYVPSLGPSPRWCSFLDNITEELEESETPSVYDDYKFVTMAELEDLGLSNLVGTNLLRAYMHGYFMDMRLYKKARSLVNPFAHEDYRKQKIREQIETQRDRKTEIKRLPKVNKDLAQRLLLEAEDSEQLDEKKKRKKPKDTGAEGPTLLSDDRFKNLFDNPEYQIDPNSEEFKLLNPHLAKMEKIKRKKLSEKLLLREKFQPVEAEEAIPSGSEDAVGQESSDDFASSNESEDEGDNEEFQRQLKSAHKAVQRDKKAAELEERRQKILRNLSKPKGKLMELKPGEEFKGWQTETELVRGKKEFSRMSLEERLAADAEDNEDLVESAGSMGNRQITFDLKRKGQKLREQRAEEHVRERRSVRRSTAEISKTIKKAPKFWAGKRVA